MVWAGWAAVSALAVTRSGLRAEPVGPEGWSERRVSEEAGSGTAAGTGTGPGPEHAGAEPWRAAAGPDAHAAKVGTGKASEASGIQGPVSSLSFPGKASRLESAGVENAGPMTITDTASTVEAVEPRAGSGSMLEQLAAADPVAVDLPVPSLRRLPGTVMILGSALGAPRKKRKLQHCLQVPGVRHCIWVLPATL